MINGGELRKGGKVMYEGNPHIVVDFQHVKMARGRPHVKAKMKNLLTGAVIEKSFLTTESFEEPDLETRNMQYLYEQTGEYFFMDLQTYDQFPIDIETLGDNRWYLMENEEYPVTLFEGNPISVDMPAAVILTVVESEPAVKGDTVSNITKAAKVETGLEIKVPPFIKEGDKVKIDTRTGDYIERAN